MQNNEEDKKKKTDKHRELAEFLKNFSGTDRARAEEDFGDGFYRLHVEEAEKRQAKHDIRSVEDALLELLRNSRDAGATHIAVATSLRDKRYREMVVIDNGEGVPYKFFKLIFEPRVTSRLSKVIEDDYGVHGRGMALYAVKVHAEEAKVSYSKAFSGTGFKVIFDTEEIPERKNQTEKPRIIKGKDGIELRGVKNILYTLTEFTISNDSISIFYGSPTEVLNTMLGNAGFKPLIDSLGINKQSTAENIEDVAGKLGLSISLRNSYRILSGEAGEAVSINNYFKLRRIRKDLPASGIKFVSDEWLEIKKKIERILKPYLKDYRFEIKDIRQKRRKSELKIIISLEEPADFI